MKNKLFLSIFYYKQRDQGRKELQALNEHFFQKSESPICVGDGLNGIGVYETGEVEPEDQGKTDKVVMIGHPNYSRLCSVLHNGHYVMIT